MCITLRDLPPMLRRKMGSRARTPCYTVRGKGHDSCLLLGMAGGCEVRCAARGAQGCPSEQGSCTPGSCDQGQGPCHQPGSALSLPRELPMVLWGEAVGGRRDPRWGRVLLLSRGCCADKDFSQLHIIPRTLAEEAFQEDQGRGYLKGKEPTLSVFYS